MTVEEIMDRVRLAFLESGKTYEQAAAEAQLSYATTYALITGRRDNPSIRVLLLLCGALGIEIEARRASNGQDKNHP